MKYDTLIYLELLLGHIASWKAPLFEQEDQDTGNHVPSNAKVICVQNVWAKELKAKTRELSHGWYLPPNVISMQR